MKHNLDLELKDLLQFNATIIAGALIFLTISAFVTRPEEQLYRLMSQLYGLLLIVIFAVSSWFLLRGSRKGGGISMLFGLGWLVVFALILLAMTMFYAK